MIYLNRQMKTIMKILSFIYFFNMYNSQFLCESNTGPNLSQCNLSNNKTHTCCLGVPRNGNGNRICTPIESSDVSNKDNSNFSNGIENYIVNKYTNKNNNELKIYNLIHKTITFISFCSLFIMIINKKTTESIKNQWFR